MNACPTCGCLLPSGSGECPQCAANSARSATHPGAHRQPPRIGQRQQIANFELLRVVGRGSTGVVWEALHVQARHLVALKVLNADAVAEQEDVERFEREASIAGTLSHPCIVKVIAHGAEAGCRWLAMELVEGGSLDASLKLEIATRQRSPAPELGPQRESIRRMVGLFVGLADGLQHIHDAGIVHRDIKPLNILLAPDAQRLLLTDFGLAHVPGPSRLTQRGDFIGTIQYMSPEQLLAHRAPVDHRSDIWSLGVSLYEAITLALPHEADSDAGHIAAIAQRDPIPAGQRSAAVPRDLETILAKCLERDPARRYQSAGELSEDLVHFLEGKPIRARRRTIIGDTLRLAARHRSALIASVIVVGVVMAGFAVGRRLLLQASEREAIRFVLDRVISTGRSPAEIDPRWSDLEATARAEIGRHPRSALAVLALRASLGIEARLAAREGLLSDPPGVRLDVVPLMNVVTDTHAIVAFDVQAMLDDGPWVPVSWALRRPGMPEAVEPCWISLREIAEFRSLTAKPHLLALRSRVVVLRDPRHPGAAPAPASAGSCGNGRWETAFPTLASSDALSDEWRDIGTLEFTLFRAYPPDFPQPVTHAELPRPLATWFGPTIITVVTVPAQAGPATPSSDGSALQSLQVTADEARPARLPSGIAEGEMVIAAVLLRGDFTGVPPAALAGRATLRDAAGTGLASFEMAFGPRQSISAAAGIVTSRSDVGWGGLEMVAPSPGHAAFIPFDLRAAPRERARTGLLELEPSKVTALDWGFDRYLAERTAIPVQLEWMTASGPLLDAMRSVLPASDPP